MSDFSLFRGESGIRKQRYTEISGKPESCVQVFSFLSLAFHPRNDYTPLLVLLYIQFLYALN